ncbi:MAG: GHMP kinase, partial [Pirellulaceae bacterium]|nr:GHMP kinase [Pirellulaceae bacterium]
PENQIRIVERARSAGASAKFAGSGGAILGAYPDDATFERLCANLETIGCRVIRPMIAAPAV